MSGDTEKLLQLIKAQDSLLECYRLRTHPSGKLLDELKRLRAELNAELDKLKGK